MNGMLVFDVIRFELTRSLTVSRMMVWGALVAFPVTLVGILANRLALVEDAPKDQILGTVMFILIPEIVCLLGLLLWATPAIATEIEGQTWIYLAMRRSGRGVVAIGKYLTAVLWTLSAALAATTICVALSWPEDLVFMWLVLSGLVTLSCFAHAALYLFIGLMFRKRTMVTAVGFTLIVEFGLTFVPALANKLTVNYRLRGLFQNWLEWDTLKTPAEAVYGSEPVSTHLMALAIYTTLLLGLSLWKLRVSEFPNQQDG
ncbi:MAG: hypothetical protein AAFX06_19910 [Planctomycetota bacterium]